MNEIEFEFKVCEPEFPDAVVPAPQVNVFQLGIKEKKVFVYFMENSAFSISGGFVDSALGKVYLYYQIENPSGAICASNKLRKVSYTFTDANGMASEFVFKGIKKDVISSQSTQCR